MGLRQIDNSYCTQAEIDFKNEIESIKSALHQIINTYGIIDTNGIPCDAGGKDRIIAFRTKCRSTVMSIYRYKAKLIEYVLYIAKEVLSDSQNNDHEALEELRKIYMDEYYKMKERSN